MALENTERANKLRYKIGSWLYDTSFDERGNPIQTPNMSFRRRLGWSLIIFVATGLVGTVAR